MKVLLVLSSLLGILSADACSFGQQETSGGGEKFSHIYVSVSSFGDARVGAILIDRKGRHTGWSLNSAVQEIPGCWEEYGSDEGIPDEYSAEDTTAKDTTADDTTDDRTHDTLAVEVDSPPMYHHFTILGTSYHRAPGSVSGPGLIVEGGCELRVDPISSGRVTLVITGSGSPDSGIGQDACQDTTSAMVKTGVTSRWWLSWKTGGNKCFVKISKISAKESKGHQK